MATEPPPSQAPFPVSSDSSTPRNANTRPSSAAGSSSSVTIRSGSLIRRMKVIQFRPRRSLLASLTDTRSEEPSSTAETASTPNAIHGVVRDSGCMILCTPS